MKILVFDESMPGKAFALGNGRRRFLTNGKRLFGCVVIILSLSSSARTETITYAANTIVIPMDVTGTENQDNGIFTAYGLVYRLLLQGIRVDWAIKNPKSYGEVDFTAPVMRNITSSGFGVTTFARDYRGGPFIIDSSFYDAALPIIQNYQSSYPSTKAHRAEATFTANIDRKLYAAPTIRVFIDGNEHIAFRYLNAAAIPMSDGSAWPTEKCPNPQVSCCLDCLTEGMLKGPTTTDHTDGVLFDAQDRPTACQIMSMHYNPPIAGSDLATAHEVAEEVKAFLTGHPVHAFFECAAIEWFEKNSSAAPLITTAGLEATGKPNSVDYLNSERPFAQAHGTFQPQGGSVPAYKLRTGSSYYSSIAVMVKGAGSAPGTKDIWVTDQLAGNPNNGKVSYLGGHQYSVNVPLSANPGSQGTRYFLNSLFEAPCTSEAIPTLNLILSGPSFTNATTVVYTINYTAIGSGYLSNFQIVFPLPGNVTCVSTTGGGTCSASNATWTLGNLSAGESGSVTVTVSFSADGTYNFRADGNWKVGLTSFSGNSNTITTVRDTVAPDAPIVSTPSNGLLTNNHTPLISGTAEPNATITIYIDGLVAGTVIADSNGNYSFIPPTPLSDGDHTVRTTATDAAGNTSAFSNTNSFTVYTIALLRYGGVSSCSPLTPPASSIFVAQYPVQPALSPTRDMEVPNFDSAESFPHEFTDLSGSSPCLIFYQLEGNTGNTLRVTKNAGKLVITF